jgi:hypothetical protein
MNSKALLTLCAAALMLAAAAPAQFVEVEAVIDVTSWHYHEETGLPLKSSRSFAVRCVVGTNTWLIENHSRTNFKESLWFVDAKLIRQITSNQDSISDEPGFLPVRRGMRSANVTASDDGYPAGEMFVNIPWFAFCSGPYLKRSGRSVPLLAPAKDQPAFGFKDTTTTASDGLGLPQRVDLFTSKGQLKSEYRVQQSTNVLGWSFPTAFTFAQNEPDQFDKWRRQLTASGRVTNIRPASKPELPEEIQERLEMLERFPARRRSIVP